MADETRYPTGDGSQAGSWTLEPTSPTTHFDKVDETPADGVEYITLTTNGGGRSLYTHSAFTIPSTATITSLRIYYTAQREGGGPANIASALQVNGTLYDTVDAGLSPANGTFTEYYYDYTENPDTSLAWLYDDINGSGSNPLQQFGVDSGDANPDVTLDACWAVVTYTTVVLELLAGQSDGVAVVANIPAMKATRTVIGSSAGICIVSNIPEIKCSLDIGGTSDGVAIAGDIPTLKRGRRLGGASDGTSTVEATVITGVTELLAGASDGLSTAGAAVKVTKTFIGLSEGVGAHSPPTELKVTRELAGASDGTSTAGANLLSLKVLTVVPLDGDAVIKQSGGDTNFGTETDFHVRSSSTTFVYRSVMEADISAEVPAGSTIIKAELSLYTESASHSGRAVHVNRMLQPDWIEGDLTDGVTWNEYWHDNSDHPASCNAWTAGGGDYSEVDQATSDSLTADERQLWDITDLAQDALDSRSGRILMLVKLNDTDETSGTTYEIVYSSEEHGTPGNRPTLYLEWTEPPIKLLAGGSDGTSTAAVAKMDSVKALAGASDGTSTASATVEPDPSNLVDTYVRHDASTTNYGDSQQLIVYRDWSNGFSRVTLMRWDFSHIPADVTVDSALLNLYAYQDDAADIDVYCQHIESVGQAFTEAGATWMTYDGTNGWDSGTDISAADATTTNEAYDTSTGSDNHWFEWDITAMVQHCIDNHSGILEIALVTKQTGNGNFFFFSKEYPTDPSLQPKLAIAYSVGNEELLAGQSDGSSTASAVVKVTKELAGQSDGAAVVSDIPELKASFEISGASDGLSTASATVKCSLEMGGASAGTSTVTGIAKILKELIGASDGSSTAGVVGMTALRKLIGASDGTSTALATVEESTNLAGQADGTSTAGATVEIGQEELLAGASDGLSTASAVLKVLKELAGASNGLSTVSDTPIEIIKNLIGSSAGSTVVTDIPAMTAVRKLAGTSAGVGAVPNILLLATCPLSGASDGTSTASATLSTEGTQLLAGTSDGTSTAGAALRGTWRFIGTSGGASTVVGSLKITKELLGTSDGTSTVSAALSEATLLAGTTDGTSTVIASLVRLRELAGVSDGVSTAVATVYPIVDLAGASDGKSTVAAGVKAIRELAGATAGTSTAGAVAKITKTLVGQSDGVAVVTDIPAMTAIRKLTGASDGTSTASATLSTSAEELLAGQSDGTSAVTGVAVALRAVRGTSDGTSTAVVAEIKCSLDVGGASAGGSTVSAGVNITKKLSGLTVGLSTVNGALSPERGLAGTANGTSTTQATIITGNRELLAGTANGTSTATLALTVVPYRQRGSVTTDRIEVDPTKKQSGVSTSTAIKGNVTVDKDER